MSMYKNLAAMAVVMAVAMSPVAEAGKGKLKVDTMTTSTLTQEEMDGLVFMREEEKLARDVYRVMYDQWGKAIFTNISSSEQSHMDAVLARLNYYYIPDPVVDDATGAFVNTGLAEAYLALTEWGMQSYKDGLMVGGYIEELDILDLEEVIEESHQEDIIEIYEELLRGSRNHLRAFAGALEDRGIVYKAQLMEQEDVDEILDSPMERGD